MTRTFDYRLAPGIRTTPRRLYFPVWLGAFFLFLGLAWVAPNPVNQEQLAIAAALLFLAVRALVTWLRYRNTSVPVWAAVCGVHFVFYGAAIFNASRRSPSYTDGLRELPEATLTLAMLVGLLALSTMWLGRGAGNAIARGQAWRLPWIEARPGIPNRVRLLLLVGTAGTVRGVGDAGSLRAAANLATDQLALAALAWVIMISGVRRLAVWDWGLAMAFVAARLVYMREISLGGVVSLMLVVAMAMLVRSGRLPWRGILATGLVVAFLQPNKGVVRDELEAGVLSPGLDAAARWVEVSYQGWSEAFQGEGLAKSFGAVSTRSSLLSLAGVVIEKTPEFVPFQNGSTYMPLLSGLVPRAIWPDKPTLNEANRFFQVEYGLTAERDLSSTSIACGFAAEGYMNFSWLGVLLIPFLIGIPFGVLERLCFGPGASLAAVACGMGILPLFLIIESQAATYLIPFGPSLVFAHAVFWPKWKARRP